MVALLDELAAKADVDNPFFGQQRLATLRTKLQEAGPRADWRLRWETATAALERLQALGIVEEITGKARGRVFVYRRYLSLLDVGTDPL